MAWWKTAKAGDKIVCKDATGGFGDFKIRQGGVYTFEAYLGDDPFDCGPYRGASIIRLAEVENPFAHHGGFAAGRFRPVDPASKKADRGLAALKGGIKTVREQEAA